MKTFGMYVYCRRNGVTQDSGLHITIEAETLEIAKSSPRIQEEITWLYHFYDEVQVEIHEIK